jgi:fibronectin type 3 domain-containing protein
LDPSDDFELLDTTSSTSYGDTELSETTTYYYKVSAYNNAGEGNQSNHVSATTQKAPLPPPDTPSGLSASADSSSSITISWSSVPDADSYKIYRSSTGISFTSRGTSTSTSYTDTGLSSNTTYYYRVSASNAGGEGSQSISVSARTLPPPPPPNTPSDVSATADSSSSITISWTSVPDADGYRIYRSTASYLTFSLRGTSTSASYTDTGLSANTTYYYKVSAYNSTGGESSQSSYISTKTLVAVPNAPTGVSASAVLSQKVMISWNSSTNTEEYHIYRRTGSSGEFNKIGTSTITSYTDSEVEASTTYYYRVSASNASGESSLSTLSSSATTLSSDAGKTWQNAINIPSNGIVGDFPNGSNEVWFKFTRTGAGAIYAIDRNNELLSPYRGDIVVDLYGYVEGYPPFILQLEDGTPLENIDIGRGTGDPNNIVIGNWEGTYYVKVKPYSGYSFYKGTFMLYFVNL